MKYFFAVLLWILLGYNFAFNSMQLRNDASTPASTFDLIQFSYKLMLGDFDWYDETINIDQPDSGTITFILFFTSTMILMIVMLNLLIAFINDTYESTISKQDSAFLYEQIRIIAEIEKAMSRKKKRKLDKQLAELYLFILKDDLSDSMDSNFFEQNRMRRKLDLLFDKIGNLKKKKKKKGIDLHLFRNARTFNQRARSLRK